MAEHEQILADFQACPGKDHIKECIEILGQCNCNQAVSAQGHLVALRPGGM